jgi:hypothetical protein
VLVVGVARGQVVATAVELVAGQSVAEGNPVVIAEVGCTAGAVALEREVARGPAVATAVELVAGQSVAGVDPAGVVDCIVGLVATIGVSRSVLAPRLGVLA